MEFSHTLDVIEHCRISPPSGSVSPVTLPLTFFDIIWFSQPSVHCLFFYEFPLSKTHFLDTVLPNLKHSLSLTLQHFFPLAGNLTWPENSTKPAIVCTEGDSVSFTVAESRYDFYELSGNQLIDVNLLHPLIPELFSTNDERTCPTMALQVTLFPNKGICIGLHYNHGVADGKMLVHFMKCWASICRSSDASFMAADPLLCFDRSLVRDPNGIDMTLLNLLDWTKESFNIRDQHVFPAEDKFLGTFVIRPGEVKRMKLWVSTRFENQKENEAPLYLSTHVLACAYVWICLIKARGVEAMVNATDDPMFEYFALAVDCRPRRKPPLPAFYFGNGIAGVIIKASSRELIGKDGFAIAAKLIGDVIQKGDDGDEVLSYCEMYASEDFSMALERGGVFAVAGSAKLGMYDVNFGWASPKKAEIASIAKAMEISECPDEVGAVEVSLARSKMVMEAFASVFANNLEAFSEK